MRVKLQCGCLLNKGEDSYEKMHVVKEKTDTDKIDVVKLQKILNEHRAIID